MGRRPTNGPTNAELKILRVLWQRGPSTVREVNDELNAVRPTGKTTTLKFMQIMTEKGLLVRNESVRPQVYRPRSSEKTIQGKLVGDLLNRAFDGSAAQLVLRALSTQQATPEDLAAIRRTLDKMEGAER